MNQPKFLNVDNSSCGQLNFSLDLPNSLCYLYCCGFPFKSLPSKFSPENLVELRMPHILVDQLWKKGQNLMSLKVLDLSYSSNLTEIPNLSQCLKIEYLNLFGCTSLVEIPSYFQFLDKLTYVQLGWCKSLNYLLEMPGNIEFLSLQSSGIKELPLSVWSNERISEFNIEDCKELEKLPSSTCNLKVSGTFSLDHCLSLGEFSELPKDISVLDLARTSTKLLPVSSMAHLFSLTTVKLKDCQKLGILPIGICKLNSLKELDLTGCSRFKYFPVILDPKEHLEFLSSEETAIKELHSTIEFLPVLKTFQLKGCKRLESLPTSICKLKCLEGLDLSGCSRFEYFPEILEPMEHLEFLCFKGTAVKKLPCSIDNLIGLQTLDPIFAGTLRLSQAASTI
nr:disease resistance-like protein DSC1 [Malus domestica]